MTCTECATVTAIRTNSAAPTLAEQLHAGPAGEAQRGQHDGNQHQDNRDGCPYRTQQEYRDEQHRAERNRCQHGHFVVDRVAHGAIEDELAGEMVVDARMLLPSGGGSAVEEVGHLQLAQLPILGKRDADDQPGNASVPGHEAPGNFPGSERDSPDSFYIVVAQGTGVVDERVDNQLVLEAFAMGVVRNRIDAGDVGCPPQLLGQVLDGNERFPSENRAAARRYGHERGVGERVGVFQLFERHDVRVVVAKVIPNVDVHFDDASGTCGEGRHDKQGEQDGQPSPAHGERYAGFQVHVDRVRRAR